jgi:DNA-directed RNA polymerase specialized sigma24 family protein
LQLSHLPEIVSEQIKHPSFEDLIARIKSGSNSSTTELYSHLHSGMKLYLRRRIGTDFEAALGESFEAIIEGIRAGDLRDPSDLRSYVCGIMALKCKRAYYKPSQPAHHQSHAESACFGVKSDFFSQFEKTYRKQCITDALDRMPIRMQIIIQKCFVDEAPDEQVRIDLGLNHEELRSLKSRVKIKLAEEVRRIRSIQVLRKKLASLGDSSTDITVQLSTLT